MTKRLIKSNVSTAKQPTIAALETAFQLVAYSSLKENNESLDFANIEVEALRIERCVESFYVSEKHDMQYLEFASNFLRMNFKELVFGTKYLFDYLGDTINPEQETHSFLDNSQIVSY